MPACKYAPLELIKNLKDDAFFEKLYGKNIDYDFSGSVSNLVMLLMENKEFKLLEKLVDRAKTLFNDKSKRHIKDFYRSFLELVADLFDLPREIYENDEAIRRVFDILIK